MSDSQRRRQTMPDQSARTHQFPTVPPEHLMALMNATGCAPAEQDGAPGQMRARCPFHRGAQRPTVAVDAAEGRFHCRACGLRGTAATFAAMVWGVAVAEAHEMLTRLNGDAPTTTRPRPIALREGQKDLDLAMRRQNTHLLTKASEFFKRQLGAGGAGDEYLGVLGLETAEARRAEIGFSGGGGLMRWLRRNGCAETEIESSPLAKINTAGRTTERYRTVLTLADTDVIGAAKWIMMVPAVPDHAGSAERRPRIVALPGQRPYMLGVAAIRKRVGYLAVTDDARLYMIFKATGTPCTFVVGRPDAAKITEKAGSKNPRTVGLMLTDTDLQTETAKALQADARIGTVDPWGTEEMADAIRPQTRDLGRFERASRAAASGSGSP